MDKEIFSPMAIDAIGEIMNISLGSSATAVSNLLDHRVDITTPRVSVVMAEEFSLGNLEPAIALVIKYVSGLEGSNIMLLKRSDIKVIVDILMGSETPDDEFELNELTISAVCEVMNQMMGAASTALSDFLERSVNISTPESFELDDLQVFKEEHFPVKSGPVVVVRFMLSIENALQSEFINLMSVELARELVSGFGLEDEEIVVASDMPASTAAAPVTAAPAPAAQQPTSQPPPQQSAPPQQAPVYEQPPQAPYPAPPPAAYAQPTAPPGQYYYEQPPAPGQVPPGYPPPPGAYPPQYPYPMPSYPQNYPPQNRVVNTQPAALSPMDVLQTLGEEQSQNLELIMSVPLEVSVEIGRTRRKVQEILSYTKGSLVVLDKLAGDQVDLFVNGKCIARGDVVVIDDNFGIRITEILQRSALDELTDSYRKN